MLQQRQFAQQGFSKLNSLLGVKPAIFNRKIEWVCCYLA
jgi:hypothetical protein